MRQRAERRLAQQRAFDKQSRAIAAEEDFIRRNIAGQNSAQAKGRRRRLERVSRLSPPPGEDGAMALRLEAAERGGDQVLVAERRARSHRGAGAAGPILGHGSRAGRRGRAGRTERGGQDDAAPRDRGRASGRRGRGPDPDSVRIAHYRQDLAQVPSDRSLYDAHRRPAAALGPRADPGPPRPLRLLRRLGAAARRHAVRAASAPESRWR